ncbi:hypothetical protein BDN72DRAFT_836860 [Pluteus cervinus]|uniref:Uncharacterized protein n=1 Tax=Pluteus cervinus TaxID=181527 RepID=A0ACD3B2W6_9AGAR|nr:hypothetical protein BDN72DRAFT_836860 [Pluteus cervinus]
MSPTATIRHLAVSNFNPTLNDPSLALKLVNHGSRLATFVQAALAIAIPLLGSTGVMVGSVADSLSLEQAPIPTSYAYQTASRSVNMPASTTIDATSSFSSTTQTFLSATVVLFAIICGGMMVFKRQYHRQEGVKVEGESRKGGESREWKKEDGQRRVQGGGGQPSSQTSLSPSPGHQGPVSNSSSSTPAPPASHSPPASTPTLNQQPPPDPRPNRNPDGGDDNPNDESHSEGDHSTSGSSRPTSPPDGDGDDDPPPPTNHVGYDISPRSRDSFNLRVLLVVAIILCAFLRTLVFIAVRKRQSVRQIVVLGVEALDRSTQNLRSSVGVALERPEWLKSLMTSSVLVFWTQLGSTTTEEIQEMFVEEMKFEEVIKGKVHEDQEDTTITHNQAFGYGSSPSSRGVAVLSNVLVDVEPIQELELDYPIPLSVLASTTVTTPSSSTVASSTPIISSNSIAILTSHVTTSLSPSPHTTASLLPPLTEVTVIYALHYLETYSLTSAIVFFVAVSALYGWMRWSSGAATTSGGLDTSHGDEEGALVEVVIEGEEVGGLELRSEIEEEVVVMEEGKVADGAELKTECSVEDVASLAQCLSEDTSPHICATSRHRSPSLHSFDQGEVEKSRGERDLDASTASGSKFQKRDHNMGVQDANLANGQSDHVPVDICAPSLPHSASFKQGELDDAQFWSRHVDSLEILRSKFKNDNSSGIIDDDANMAEDQFEDSSVNICATSQSRSRSSFNPEDLERMRGGRDLDVSKMFGSKFESQDSNGVDEDESEDDSDQICALVQSSSLNQEELERLRGGRGLDASKMFETRFRSISASISDPEFYTGSTESILPQSSSDSYSYSHSASASQPNLSRLKSPPPLKRKFRMALLPSWWPSAQGDSSVSPLKPRQLFLDPNPDTSRVDWINLASTSSVRKKPIASTAGISASFSLVGCLGTPEPRSRSGLISFNRDQVLPGLFELSIPAIRQVKPSRIPVPIRTCRISLGPVCLAGPTATTQVNSKWGKKKFVPSKSCIPVLVRIPIAQPGAGPLTRVVSSQPKKVIRPEGSSLPILVDKNRRFKPLQVQGQAGPSTGTQGVPTKSIYNHYCVDQLPRRRKVEEKENIPKGWRYG